MTDKERVVKGLEVHTDMHVSCRDCPYMKPDIPAIGSVLMVKGGKRNDKE